MATAAARPETGTPRIRVRGLVKRFRTRRTEFLALDKVSLDLNAGEKVVLLGPSGCGKTTLLRCVAGLEVPDEGEIEINGVTVFSSTKGILVAPEDRGLSMVFQSYALWPHMTVFDNVAYPLKHRSSRRGQDIAARVAEALRLVGCDGLAGRYPSQLSGGQQQRVSLARAIVGNDDIVLFDEPLSNVDAKVREQLRIELIGLQKKLNFAALYVTHDQLEATAIADRIAVMRSGAVAQIGSPHAIYDSPSSTYVARFTGMSNETSGVVESMEDGVAAIETPLGSMRALGHAMLTPGARVDVLFRPEHVQVSCTAGQSGNVWPATLENAMFLGSQMEYVLRVGEAQVVARGARNDAFADGKAVWLHVQPGHLRAIATSL